MNLDRLEYEVRLLPHVVACAITDAQVSVLLDPRGDPDAVAVAVSGILITAGLDRPVRVMGGTQGVAVLPHRRLATPIAVGGGLGVGVLALATAVAALAGAPPFSEPTRPEVKAPVAAALPAPNGPDLLHLAVRPRTTGRPSLSPAVLPATTPFVEAPVVVQAPTVVALPGDIVSGALAVATGPGRGQGHAGGPVKVKDAKDTTEAVITPVTPPSSPVVEPIPVAVLPARSDETDPVVVATPGDAGAPPRPQPIAVPKHPKHHRDVGHEDRPDKDASKSRKHEVRANVERLVGRLRAQVKQAVGHGSD